MFIFVQIHTTVGHAGGQTTPAAVKLRAFSSDLL